jgi:hypothetical protein
MLVATEARGHLGPDRVRVLVRDGLVATNAIAVRCGLMGSMLEAQVLPRESRAFPRVGRTVAAETRMLIMRFRVAPHTRRVGREVQRLDVARGCDTSVAVDAIDPVRRVRAMLEGVGRLAGP